jgi:hypothetical protein
MTVAELLVFVCQILALGWVAFSVVYTSAIWAFRREGVTAAEFSSVAKGLGVLLSPDAADLLTPAGVVFRNSYRIFSIFFAVSFMLSCSATYSG